MIYEKGFKLFDFVRWHLVSVDVLPSRDSMAKGIKKIHELTKKAAKYITKSVDEDGIFHGLRMVGLLEYRGFSFILTIFIHRKG